jgi:hypothetical protein
MAMGAEWYHPAPDGRKGARRAAGRPTGATIGAARLLERTHRFLTTRGRAEVETAAELLFKALGYRRRADENDRLVFTRGRPLASLYASSLRACLGRVDVAHEAGLGEKAGVVRVVHRVETRGRIVLAEDEDLIDAEARAFERFLEEGHLDTSGLLDAARRARRDRSRLRVGAIVGAAGLVVAAVVARVVGRWWGG